MTGKLTWLTSISARSPGQSVCSSCRKPAPDKDAIFLHQRNDVSHGADGNEVEIVTQIDLAVPLARELEQSMADLEDEAHTGEIIELAVPLWVDQGMRGGQFRWQRVVVDNEHVDALLAQPRDLLHRRGAAIDCDKDGRFVLLDAPLDAVLAQAVALLHAQRQEGVHVRAEPPQDAPQERAGGDAIDIVIAEDDHLFPRGDALENPLGRAAQIGQHKGIPERLQPRVEKCADLLRLAITALPQERRDLRVEIQYPRELQRPGLGRGLHPAFAEGA